MFEFKLDTSKFKRPTGVCRDCRGFGHTKDTAPVIEGKVTIALGSGCPKCGGTGRKHA